MILFQIGTIQQSSPSTTRTSYEIYLVDCQPSQVPLDVVAAASLVLLDVELVDLRKTRFPHTVLRSIQELEAILKNAN